MYTNKKAVDAHVRSAMLKLRSETERQLRGFTIAKLYFRINEFACAEQHILSYLNAKEDNDQAHKMLGQCYQRLNKPDKALQSYQRSLQLNSKQPDVLVEVCKLLNDDKNFNSNKAKYWCELAESEKVQDDAVFTLRLKLMSKDNLGTTQVEELIQKEISARPNDVQLRVRLVRTYVEQNRILDAFKYVYNLEMKQRYELTTSAEWYNTVALVLNKYELLSNAKKDWEFWLLLIICLERQVNLSFGLSTTVQAGGITETANLLFNYDQYLYKISQVSSKLTAQKELVQYFVNHYRGQLLLHAAALIFKRELLQNKKKWKETTTAVLPVLLLGCQVQLPDSKEPWMMHCDEQGKQLLQLWSREGAFRCCQLGRTLLSCILDASDAENMSQNINMVLGAQPSLWASCEALLNQIRKTCSDKQWRRNVFAMLFCNSDQKVKEQTSMLIKCSKLAEPIYDLPTYADLENYEELAQYLQPQSLQHMVYLCLSNDNLALVRAKFFSGLNFSTPNLAFCGAESLNQLDVETFMYAATIQARRVFEVERETFDCFHAGDRQASAKPRILPFANLQSQLCTEEQANWWLAAYQVYKNLKSDNPAETRANLQFGIEAVRGINSPKMDMLIVFKLGKIFVTRAQDVVKPVEKTMLEARAESIYRYGLNMMKMHHKGVLEPFRKYFKYAKSNSKPAERETESLAEDAVSYVAARFFKKSEYEDLIEELTGVELPFATYLQAEAYRKLDETNRTPKSSKRKYLDRASECLTQTLLLLKNTHDPNHPLNSIIHSELKRVQQSSARMLNNNDCFTPSSGGVVHNNSSTYEDAEGDIFADSSFVPSLSATPSQNRNRRDSAAAANAALQSSLMRNSELESLIKQMSSTLTFLKDEIVDSIKPELVSMSKEMTSLKDKVNQIEEAMKKTRISSNPPSRGDDEASNVLDDLYMIEDALQNQMYPQQGGHNQPQHTHQSTHNMFQNMPGSAGPITGLASPFAPGQQQQPRLNTPNAMQMSAAAFGSPMFNPSYPLGYYTNPYMMNTQPPSVNGGNLLGNQRNAMGMPQYIDTTAMNFQMPHLSMPQQQDNRSNNLYSLLNQPSTIAPSQQASQLPALSMPSLINTNSSVGGPTTTTATTPSLQFNKALNNQPVEKGPPANVVITSSDPLPNPNVLTQQTQQPTLSVTIPPHHIKPSLVQSNETLSTQMTTTTTNISTFTFGLSTATSSSSLLGNLANFSTGTNSTTTQSSAANMFQIPTTKEQQNKSIESGELNKSQSSERYEDEDYDPRPDFKPIIPLPDEVPVVTGEEDEEVMFSHHAKLYRMVEKEWKERGLGEIKILKNKDGYSRIVMRRDQTHKICANHKIIKELAITAPKNESKGYIWAARDFADEELKTEQFFVRFKQAETAKQFYDAFKQAQKEHADLEGGKKPTATGTKPALKKDEQEKPQFALTKSSVTNFATSTPANKTETAKSQTNAVPTTSLIPTTTASKLLFSGLSFASKTETTQTNEGQQAKPTTGSPFANFTFDKPAVTAAAALTVTSSTTTTTSSSPFANLLSNLGKTNQSSPFSTLNLPNMFQSQTSNNTIGIAPTFTTSSTPTTTLSKSESNANKSAASDGEDDYVPTAEFNPVIPLPELVEVKTGEENELVLFEHRAKLLRFDKEVGEWKERGLGNIKLLQDKDDVNKVRIVMRREQVHKLCCNQRLYKDTTFMYAKNSQTALTWAGQDFSENELITEMLTIRFKTPDICKKFHEAVLEAQAKMSDDVKRIAGEKEMKVKKEQELKEKTEEKNSSTGTKGFGDQFKPKAGSWNCDACYISNGSEQLYCVACDSPKDDTVPKKNTANTSLLPSGTNTFSFGFSPAATKDSGNAASTTFKPNFTFGNVAGSATNIKPEAAAATTPAVPIGNGFGDKFKPKAGSWNCDGCYLTNAGDTTYCKACNSPKDGTVSPAKDKDVATPQNLLALSNPNQKFTFGFATGPPNAVEKDNKNGSGPGAFSFGQITATKSEPPTKPLMFGKIGEDSAKSFSFTAPTPTTGLSGSNTNIQKQTFSFTLHSDAMQKPAGDGKFMFTSKPKSPGKAGKPNLTEQDDEAGDEGDYHEEEENNTYFTPVIPLPDKVDVKTGEENEELLYVHRAKLFRYTEHEWKERGVGDVKILRHKDTQKLRVVMRRDQVLKICLNHVLNDSVSYKSQDDKSWLFVVNDFSEGELELEKFALRFKSKEIAEGFMSAVKAALDGTAPVIEASSSNTSLNISSSANTTTSTNINTNDFDKKLCEKLQLPDDFFLPKPACPGCIGCDPDKFVFAEPKSMECFVIADDADSANMPELPMEMPLLQLPSSKSAPANRSLLKQSALSPSPATVANTTATPKNKNENIFSGFGNAATNANSTFGANAGDKSTASSVNFSFAAAFNSNNKLESGGSLFGNTPLFGTSSAENTKGFGSTTPFIFSNATAKNMSGGPSIFGNSTALSTSGSSLFSGKSNSDSSDTQTASIFGNKLTNDTSKNDKENVDSKVEADKPETKTIFGGTGNANNSISGGSLFSGFNTSDTGGTIFGGKPVFGTAKPFFSNFSVTDDVNKSSDGQKLIFGTATNTNNSNVLFSAGNATTFADLAAKTKSTSDATQTSTTTPATVNNSILSTSSTSVTTTPTATPTFADLSNKPGAIVDFATLAANAKTNDKTKTEKPGPGGFIGLTNQADAFSNFKTPEKNGTKNNDSARSTGGGGDADGNDENQDENYDPHFDPIIELPNEIVVSTGEEEETKLFGQRAVLFRFDATNKEWKERGVGELKILMHPKHQTYRLVMRREQIHKLVLNHAVGGDFIFNTMNNNPKSFVWAALNFAESTEGELEKLAVRFKKIELADEFRNQLNECIAAAKEKHVVSNE